MEWNAQLVHRWLCLPLLLLLAGPALGQTGASPGWGGVTGEGGCVRTPRGDSAEACVSVPALIGLSSATVTPDGRQLLVAGGTDNFTFFGHGDGYGSLAAFARSSQDGTLTAASCFSADGGDATGGAGCTPATALSDASSVAVSPAGDAIAVTARGSGSLTLFARDTETGALSELGCFQQNVPLGGTCRPAPLLEGAGQVTFTPDGRDVLVLSPPRNALVVFHAADDGPIEMSCYSATGTSGSCTRMPRLLSPSGLVVSPDGDQVYVVTELGVLWLTRDGEGGLASTGCVPVDPTRSECPKSFTDDTGYYAYDTYSYGYGRDSIAAHRLAISGDGQALYAIADDRLLKLTRAPDGGLVAGSCYSYAYEPEVVDDEVIDDEIDEDETAGGTPPAPESPCVGVHDLDEPRAVAAAGDRDVLVSTGYGGIAVLRRGDDGLLTWQGCLDNDDTACAGLPDLSYFIGDLVADPDGSYVYALGDNRVVTLGRTPSLRRTGRRSAAIMCPGACRGTARALVYGTGLGALPVARGAVRRFATAANGRARLTVPLPRSRGRVVLRAVTGSLAPGAVPLGERSVRRLPSCFAPGCPLLGGRVAGPRRRAGRFVAFTVRSLVAPLVVHTAVVVADRLHRRLRVVASAQDGGYGVTVPAIVLKPHGAVAWLSCVGHDGRCAGEKADQIHIDDALGARLLAVAPGRVSADLLRREGSTLTFEVDGTLRHAPLR